MNVAAFIVAAMNIPHIIECSSPDSATFDILFCLFRTWSLTLFTNSAASLPMTKVSLRNVTDLLSDGKTPYERLFGQPFKGPIIPFGSLVEYHPITAKDQSKIHEFGKKVLPGLFLGYALYAGRIWKGDVLVADHVELETTDASEIYSKRLNAKEVIFP